MRFLDAQRKDGVEPKASIMPPDENKMAPGSRTDQGGRTRNPQDLVSDSRGTEGISASRVTKLAADLGVDLKGFKGTGPGGAITEKDVRLAARSKANTEGEGDNR